MTPATAPFQPSTDASPTASVDAREIAKFSAMAGAWWDPAGKFRPLHRLNPVRLAYIRDRAAARFGREALSPQPISSRESPASGFGESASRPKRAAARSRI